METPDDGGDTRAASRRRSRRARRAASRTPTARRRATRSPPARRESSRPPRARGTTCRRPAGAERRAPRAPRRTAASRRRRSAESGGTGGRRAAAGSAPASAARRASVRSVTVQPLSCTSQWTNAPTRVGQRLLDRVAGDAALAVRLGHRQRDDRRLRRPIRRDTATARRTRACSVSRSPVISGANAAFTARWIAGVARKLVCRNARCAPRDSSSSHTSLIGPDVGAPEAVDRLLRIADDEQLAGHGRDAPPVALGRIVGGQQQQDLGLQRIGVLELVDEQMREARWNAARTRGCADEQVARAQQQVDEIERAGALLQLLVAVDDVAQLLVQQRREIGSRRRAETRRARASALRTPAHTASRVTPAPIGALAAAARAPEVAVLREIDRRALPSRRDRRRRTASAVSMSWLSSRTARVSRYSGSRMRRRRAR